MSRERPLRTDASRKTRKRAVLDEAALYEYAVKALGRSMRTVAELERAMRAKVELGEEGQRKITAVLLRLKEHHYLDDAAFASIYARLRQENERFGRRRVEIDLARKGIASDLIASTLGAAYQDTNEEELGRRYLERKRIGKPQHPKETARVVRRLAAAGFSFSTISKILRNWEIELGEEELNLPEDSSGDS
jgi:regulatory protein